MAQKEKANNSRKQGASNSRKRAESPAEKKAKRNAAALDISDEERIFDESTRRNIVGVVLIVLAVVLMVAAILPSEAVLTSFLSQALHLSLGLGAYLLPLVLAACGLSFFVSYSQGRLSLRLALGLCLIVVAVLGILGLSYPVDTNAQGVPEDLFSNDELAARGGYVGAGIAWVGFTLFGQVISIIIMVGIILIGLIIAGLSFTKIIEKFRTQREQKRAEQERLEQEQSVMPPPPYTEVAGGFVPVEVGAQSRPSRSRGRRNSQMKTQTMDALTSSMPAEQNQALSSEAAEAALSENQPAKKQQMTRRLGKRAEEEAKKEQQRALSPAEKKKGRVLASSSATIKEGTESTDGFRLPPFSFLRATKPASREQQNEKELQETARCLQETLEDFKIMARVVGWVAGPTVTLFKVDLPAGVRVSRVTALEADIALALAAQGVRIFAPIPGTNYVGIEVPNKTRRTVFLGDVLKDAPEGPLQVAIGENVEGEHILADLARMPHLLIGGTTGSGKSVSINAMIMSILMRATPSEVRFIMIDPKRVEFTPYNGIPHLYVPVVTEAKEAASALAWGVAEMERRLKVFSKAGARNISQFNDIVAAEQKAIVQAEAKGKEPPEAQWGEKLPYIVIIIDELADLMMNVGKEVEFSISRIAQLARAAGIHLIVATQRPSANVVTGLIKANITNRIAFNVATGIDSRVILDMAGAERLIGLGDLLFSKPEYSKPQRMQACFVSNEEISAVVSFLKEQGEPEYHTEILKTNLISLGDSQPDGSGGGSSDDDPLLWEAADIVVASGLGSTSNIQRRLKVGYSRAGRIMDMLENKGVVGPPNGSKPREVLVDSLELETLKAFETKDASEE